MMTMIKTGAKRTGDGPITKFIYTCHMSHSFANNLHHVLFDDKVFVLFLQTNGGH